MEKMVRRIRLPIALPIVFVAVSMFLLRWAYRIESDLHQRLHLHGPLWPLPRVICMGVSAPAIVGNLLVRLGVIPPWILGFQAIDFAFLIGVALTWFLVGRALDQHGPMGRVWGERAVARGYEADVLYGIVGALLAGYGLHAWMYFNRTLAILVSAWSCFLLILCSTGVVAKFRTRWHARG